MDKCALAKKNENSDRTVALSPGRKWKITVDGLKPFDLKYLTSTVIYGHAVFQFSVWKGQFSGRTGMFVPHHDEDIPSDDRLAFADSV